MGTETLITRVNWCKRLHVHQRQRWDNEEGTQWLFSSLYERQSAAKDGPTHRTRVGQEESITCVYVIWKSTPCVYSKQTEEKYRLLACALHGTQTMIDPSHVFGATIGAGSNDEPGHLVTQRQGPESAFCE